MTEASRRDVLRLGLGLAGGGLTGLAGCTLSDPTVDGPTGNPSATSASVSPRASSSKRATAAPTVSTAQLGSESEIRLSEYASAISTGKRAELSRSQRAMLRAVMAAHLAHARRLSDYAPPGPAPVIKGSVQSALADLARRERSAAKKYQRNALASSGTDALVWTSLDLAARSFATAATDPSPPRVAALRTPKPTALLSDTAATQEMVRQLHAVVYGYQVAIGRLSVLSQEHTRAVRELLVERVRRDRLIAWLIRRSADVPAAEAAYVPSVNPSTAIKAERLIMSMHIALEPFCGLMVAAANDRDRARAVTALSATTATAKAWGAPVNPWPGYA